MLASAAPRQQSITFSLSLGKNQKGKISVLDGIRSHMTLHGGTVLGPIRVDPSSTFALVHSQRIFCPRMFSLGLANLKKQSSVTRNTRVRTKTVSFPNGVLSVRMVGTSLYAIRT